MKTRRLKIDVQKLVIVGVLIIIMAVLSILTPKFLTYINLNNVIMQVALIMDCSGSMYGSTIQNAKGASITIVGPALTITGTSLVISGSPWSVT